MEQVTAFQDEMLRREIRHRWVNFPASLQLALIALCRDNGNANVFGRGDLEYHCDEQGVEMETFFSCMADIIVSTSKNGRGIEQYQLMSYFMDFVRSQKGTT